MYAEICKAFSLKRFYRNSVVISFKNFHRNFGNITGLEKFYRNTVKLLAKQIFYRNFVIPIALKVLYRNNINILALKNSIEIFLSF